MLYVCVYKEKNVLPVDIWDCKDDMFWHFDQITFWHLETNIDSYRTASFQNSHFSLQIALKWHLQLKCQFKRKCFSLNWHRATKPFDSKFPFVGE